MGAEQGRGGDKIGSWAIRVGTEIRQKQGGYENRGAGCSWRSRTSGLGGRGASSQRCREISKATQLTWRLHGTGAAACGVPSINSDVAWSWEYEAGGTGKLRSSSRGLLHLGGLSSWEIREWGAGRDGAADT